MSFDLDSILISLFFSIIGIVALRYGKLQVSARHMILGFLLIGYGYFIYNPWLSFGTGVVLTVLLFWP